MSSDQIILFEDIREWFGKEWRSELTVHGNVNNLVQELEHFRSLMSVLRVFILDIDDWLDDYDGGDFNATAEEVGSGERPA